MDYSDEMDHQILMHRNTHFGGSFSAMIEYYEREGKGSQPELELKRIYQLQDLEQSNPSCFEGFLLPEEEKQVEQSIELYKKFQELYEDPHAPEIGIRIADLVLSEEEDPTQEINRIVELGSAATPALIELLRSDVFCDPLSPGYGYSAAYAAVALGKIGDPQAIVPLFEAMRRRDYFLEAAAIDSLRMFGHQAKDFLLSRLQLSPISEENERAAIALTNFENDEEIAKAALELLEKIARDKKQLSFSSYLSLSLGGLKLQADKERAHALLLDETIPNELRKDLKKSLDEGKNL